MEQVKQVALITGASKGIGLEVARALHAQGFSLCLLGRSKEDLEAQWGACGGEVLTMAGDVRSREDAKAAVEGAQAAFGRIDVLVNNAGMLPPRIDLTQESESILQDTLQTNLMGPWHFTRLVLPVMRRQRSGYVFNISSMSGKRAFRGRGSYSMSKFGVQALTEATLRENQEFGIKATAICPGFVNTTLIDAECSQAEIERTDLIQPSDIAKTVLYLLSLSPKAYVMEVLMERELWR